MQSRFWGLFAAIIGRAIYDRSAHQIVLSRQGVLAGPSHQVFYFVRNRGRLDCPPQCTVMRPLLLINHRLIFSFPESIPGLGGVDAIVSEGPKEAVICLTL